MALRAHESALLSVVGAAMGVILHAVRQRKFAAHRGGVDEAVEIDPLPAVHGLRPPAIRLANPGGGDRLFEGDKMFTGHWWIPVWFMQTGEFFFKKLSRSVRTGRIHSSGH